MAGTEGSPVVEGAPTSEPPHISAGHDNDDSHKAPDADYPSPRPRLSIVSGLVVEKPLTSAMQSHFTAIADGAHIWHEMDSSSMKYCLTCKKRLGFKHGYRCGACKYTVDGRCRERQDITPPCSHKFVLSTDRTAVHEVEHQWIDGNFNLRDCSICRKRIQGGFSVTRPCAVRCAWCKIIAHYECSRTQDQSCTLGKHARLMVPNSSITVILDSSSSSVRGRRAGTPPHSGPSTPQPGPQHQIVAPIAHSCVGVPVRRSSDHGSATASVPTTPQATPQSDDKVTRSESLRSLGSVGSGDVPSSSTSGSAVARTSSLTKSQRRNQRRSMRRRSKNKLGSVIIRTLPDSIPLVVFINPKSGSKQGQKLMKDFQWLLNPVQVFDLTNGGPKTGLSLFADVPNFRILVCGGDGTVGWVLSVLDELNIVPCPPIAVMPLGTGNDLARALKWGGGYSDEDVSPMLTAVEDAEIMPMDRWYLRVTPYHENITSSNGSLHSPSLSPLPQSPTTTAIDGNKSLSLQDTLQTADGGAGGSGASALTSNKLMGMSQSWSGGLDRSDEAGTSNATGGMSLSAMPDTKAHKGKKRRKGKDKDKMAFSPTLTAAQSISSLVDSGAGSPIFEGAGVANLPLNVMNNYFSFGVDAQTVLAFHEAREKNPERFKSRVGNKIYYGLNGLRDMFKHSQRGFAKHVRLECDGVDMTHILEERKLEGLVFLNITSYGSGTDPWGSSKSDGFMPQRMDDGLVEVIGLFSAFDLAKQQARLGKALRIAQCRRARVVTLKDLPVQVDGEPCLLAPSEIIIEHHNCVQMLQRRDNKGDSKEKLMSPQNAHRTANPAVSASLLRSPQQQRPRPASSDVASMVARSDANSSKQPRPHSMALSPSSSYSTIPAFTPTISTATATNPVSVPSIQVTTPPSMPTTTTTITEDAPAAPSAAIAATAAATLAAVSNLEYVPPPAHRGRNASFAAALSNSSPLDSSEV